MLGLTPDPLSAGVGMHVAVAGPYTATNGSPRWQDGADAQRKNTARGSVSSGRARAPDGALAVCRKQPFTIQTRVQSTAGVLRAGFLRLVLVDGHNVPLGLVEAVRTAPLEEGVRVPLSGPDGERVLPLQVHHR